MKDISEMDSLALEGLNPAIADELRTSGSRARLWDLADDLLGPAGIKAYAQSIGRKPHSLQRTFANHESRTGRFFEVICALLDQLRRHGSDPRMVLHLIAPGDVKRINAHSSEGALWRLNAVGGPHLTKNLAARTGWECDKLHKHMVASSRQAYPHLHVIALLLEQLAGRHGIAPVDALAHTLLCDPPEATSTCEDRTDV